MIVCDMIDVCTCKKNDGVTHPRCFPHLPSLHPRRRFTTLSGTLTGEKVRDMLHRLYVQLNGLSDAHGLFKVETIGPSQSVTVCHISPQSVSPAAGGAQAERPRPHPPAGDCFIAAAGVPRPQEDHVLRAARFCADAVAATAATLVDTEAPELGYLSCRVGFHTGCAQPRPARARRRCGSLAH